MTPFYLAAVNLWYIALIGFACSLGIVYSRRFHAARTTRGHARLEVQSMHDAPTPRIGGLAVVVALVVTYSVLPAITHVTFAFLLLSSIPVLFAGIAEDVSHAVSPKKRLVASAISSVIMVYLSGVVLRTPGMPMLDAVLAIWPIAFLFTLLVTSSLAHALNLIDGLNGLAGGVALTMTAGLGLIAHEVQDAEILWICAAIFMAIVGFLLVNFPLGKVFLGDGGAYTLGHILAWVAILLLTRNSELSPWSMILCGFWPALDTITTVIRRLRLGRSVDKPDRMHFHHVVMRLVRATVGRRKSRLVSNSLAGALMAPLYILPVALGVATSQNHMAGFIAIVLSSIFYLAVQFSIVRRFRKYAKVAKALGLKQD